MSAFAAGTLTADGGHPVRWVATGRSGGVSIPPYDSLNLGDHVGDDPVAVSTNRDLVKALVPGAELCLLTGVHGGEVAVVSGPGIITGVDALITTHCNLALVALVADCVPIALADPAAGVIGVVHCGWQGLSAGVVDHAVEAMRGLGASAIQAVLGPSVCGSCYPVPPERWERVRQVAPEACLGSAQQPSIDVAAGVVSQLRAHGIGASRVSGCTAEDSSLFSYRRDTVTGRQGMIVVR